MFGFSLTKLLFTIAVVAFVLYGFKWVGRMQVKRDAAARQRLRRKKGAGPRPKTTDADADVDAEDMAECPACGTFVATVGAKSCGRQDCPYPG